MKFAIVDEIERGQEVDATSARRHERARAEEALYFAVGWLVQQNVARTTPRSFGLPNGGTDTRPQPTENWRPADGGLTMHGSARFDMRGAASDPADDLRRLVTEADTEALGRVRLMIDRSPRGLSIVLGVASDRLGAAHVQRVALQRALEGAGLAVESVRIERLETDGTGLAPSALEDDASGDAWVRDGTVTRAAAAPSAPAPKRLLFTIG
jgi:hypothetical protein